MTLPRLNLVIDKEEWLKKAPLPTGVSVDDIFSCDQRLIEVKT